MLYKIIINADLEIETKESCMSFAHSAQKLQQRVLSISGDADAQWPGEVGLCQVAVQLHVACPLRMLDQQLFLLPFLVEKDSHSFSVKGTLQGLDGKAKTKMAGWPSPEGR